MAGMVPPDLIVNENGLEVYITSGASGMLPAFQHALGATGEYDILAYLHDDTIINDPGWVAKVMREFEDPKVGLVGFGGATRHGDPFMYNKPYEYQQLARAGFASNMRDAENHGERFTGSRDVAVLDGFALIVRRAVLEAAGGWPLNTPIGYVCYDYWLSCMARRLGYRIRRVGVACDHLGGQTFVKLGIGQDPKHWKQYLDSHRYIYDEFKDVLPYEVPR
jgi:GT2 family glycosyltransferase